MVVLLLGVGLAVAVVVALLLAARGTSVLIVKVLGMEIGGPESAAKVVKSLDAVRP
jgi:hypothetical protein